jgi:hypothetical protein
MNGQAEAGEKRDEKGRFAQGNAGGPGRPARAREEAYLRVITEVVKLDDWRKVVLAAVQDATLGEDGPTRERGRRWLGDYILGRPRQTILVNKDSGADSTEFEHLSDEELERIASEPGGDAGDGAGDLAGEEDSEG